MQKTTALHYRLTDYQGNNTMMLTPEGLVEDTVRYYPYGEPIRYPVRGGHRLTAARHLYADKEYEGAGDPINLIDPDGLKPTEKESAMMCAFAYNDIDFDLIGGWEWIEDSGFNITDGNTGLQSRLFRRPKENGDFEYALAFAGTQDEMDWKENIQQLLGRSTQYSRAMILIIGNPFT